MAMGIVNITEDTAGVGLPSKLTIWQVLTLCNLVDQAVELCTGQAVMFYLKGDGENARLWQGQAEWMVSARNTTIMGAKTWDYNGACAALRGQLDALRRLAGDGSKDALVAAGETVLARAGIGDGYGAWGLDGH